MSLLKKLLATLRPLYDFRALLLLFVAFLTGAVTDPAATLGLAGYLAYVIGMAGAMHYQRTSQHIRSALESGNMASALVVLARVILILGLLVTLMAWGK